MCCVPPTVHTLARHVSTRAADVRRIKVRNAGWELVPLAPGEAVADALKIRGFKLVKHDARVLEFSKPGTYVVDE